MTRHRFSAVHHLRLWLSYQRYAIGFALLSGALVWSSVTYLPWWTWPVTALVVVKMMTFAGYIVSRHSRKIRATRIAFRRIEQGRFRAQSVASYCGDPCFRLVAAEALARAGYGLRQRRTLISDFARVEHERSSATVTFDRRNGRVVTVGHETRPVGP